MDTSILLARMIGPLFLVVGAGVLVNPDAYRGMFADFLTDRALIYFSGALALIVGIAMVTFHNIWTADWRIILTIIGWISVVKGVSRILLPNVTPSAAKPFTQKGWLLPASAIVLLCFGAFLSYKGFTA